MDDTDSNWVTINRMYEDPSSLGDAWVEARKAAEKNRTLPSGEINPMYPRYALQEEVARLTYHMAFVLEKNRMLTEQVGIMAEMYPRMAILEGAYSHLMTMVQSQKIDYYNQLKEKYNASRPNANCQREAQ